MVAVVTLPSSVVLCFVRPMVMFRKISKTARSIVIAHRDFFIIAPYKYSYLLTYLLIITTEHYIGKLASQIL